MIYTIYTLSSPNDWKDVRYVGITTQTVNKRTIDMYSVALKPYCTGHNSLLSQWLREVLQSGEKPIVTTILDTFDKKEATACRISTFNSFASTGRLLNSFSGKKIGKVLRTTVDDEAAAQGRRVDVKTLSAKYSYNRKAAALGLTTIIKRKDLPDVPVHESTYEPIPS